MFQWKLALTKIILFAVITEEFVLERWFMSYFEQ